MSDMWVIPEHWLFPVDLKGRFTSSDLAAGFECWCGELKCTQGVRRE